MANPAQNEYLKERQKTILPLLGMPESQQSLVFETIATERHNILYDNFGPRQTTPLDAEVLDIITIKQLGDEEYSPSPYVCGGCDPAIPLQIQETQVGGWASHIAPYIKRNWFSTRCGDEKMLQRAMLSELPRMPFGRRLNTQQKKNLLIQAAGRQMRGEINAARSKQWTDDFLWGKTMIWGPGIPKNGGVIDMGRKKELFAYLNDGGWCNNDMGRMSTFRSFADYVYNHSDDQASYPNTFILDKVAKEKFFKGVEFTECNPCAGGFNPFVSFNRSRVSFDDSRGDTPRGIRRLSIEDDILGNDAEFWCIDEVRTECVLDGEGNDTGQKRKAPVLPEGVVIAFNRFNHSPVGIQGRIQNDFVDAPLDLWVQSYDCKNPCQGEDAKFGIRMETSPLYFNRRENTIGMLFVAPDECPPPKHVCPVEFACDPEGGKKIVAETMLREAQVAQAMAEAALKQAESKKTTKKVANADNKNGDK